MFKTNPFDLITNFLVNHVQRFTLYMLDYHGVLVSVWAILSGIVVVTTSFLLGMVTAKTLTDNLFNYAMLAFGLFMFIGPAAIQFKLERAKKYTKYKILQVSFLEGPFIKPIFIGGTLMFLYFDFITYFKDGNTFLLTVKLIHDPCYLLYFVFMCCYTRDRDPPYKTYSAFSPT